VKNELDRKTNQGIFQITMHYVYGKKSFLSKESDTLKSYREHISPTM